MKTQGADSYTIEIYAYLMFVLYGQVVYVMIVPYSGLWQVEILIFEWHANRLKF